NTHVCAYRVLHRTERLSWLTASQIWSSWIRNQCDFPATGRCRDCSTISLLKIHRKLKLTRVRRSTSRQTRPHPPTKVYRITSEAWVDTLFRRFIYNPSHHYNQHSAF